MCDECKKGLSLAHREGMEKTLEIWCEECIMSFPSFHKFLNHWFDKHFKENHGGIYTYKFVVATVKMGRL